ncbi:hypothetical protein F5Y18DRAFT_392071 [Xylariaceae sp. FL1019]|nr:hypothetical protein F5Y18DRAFT_392071 [Xylariaceae sp. FL1019]
MADPYTFYAAQAQNHELPLPPADISAFPPQAQIITLQLVNVYLLLAAMALICCWTPSPSTTKWYLFAVALADYGHIWACYVGVGPELFFNPGQWNDMLAGGVGVSAVLNVIRIATLLGVFGRVGGKSKTA